MTVWNIKTTHRRNLLRTVITVLTVITLSLTLRFVPEGEIDTTATIRAFPLVKDPGIYRGLRSLQIQSPKFLCPISRFQVVN